MLAGQTQNSEQRQAILRQAEMIERVSEKSMPEKFDREDVKDRYLDLFEVINERQIERDPKI